MVVSTLGHQLQTELCAGGLIRNFVRSWTRGTLTGPLVTYYVRRETCDICLFGLNTSSSASGCLFAGFYGIPSEFLTPPVRSALDTQ